MCGAFVQQLWREGRLLVGAEPDWQPSDSDRRFIDETVATEALHLPGPRLRAERETLVSALAYTHRCAWLLLHPGAKLELPASLNGAATADGHWSADLAFRYLPALYHRARGRAEHEDLFLALRRMLCQWPLSGVLADIAEAPSAPPDFEGHPGLCYLYAERLATRPRAGWLPAQAVRPFVERVWQVLAMDSALLIPFESPAPA